MEGHRKSQGLKGGHYLVGWKQICGPTDAGGLCILDLEKMDSALRIRWALRLRTTEDCPWTNLAASIFNAAAKMTVGNEKKCYFGLVNGLMENYSRDLYNKVQAAIKVKHTVAATLHKGECLKDINKPMSIQIFFANPGGRGCY
jgi:hypothetical protein